MNPKGQEASRINEAHLQSHVLLKTVHEENHHDEALF